MTLNTDPLCFELDGLHLRLINNRPNYTNLSFFQVTEMKFILTHGLILLLMSWLKLHYFFSKTPDAHCSWIFIVKMWKKLIIKTLKDKKKYSLWKGIISLALDYELIFKFRWLVYTFNKVTICNIIYFLQSWK